MALAVIDIFAGDVNELLIAGDVITAVGATLIQLLLTGCAVILEAIPPEFVSKGLFAGFIYETVTTSPGSIRVDKAN
jgi:hypothetical protein